MYQSSKGDVCVKIFNYILSTIIILILVNLLLFLLQNIFKYDFTFNFSNYVILYCTILFSLVTIKYIYFIINSFFKKYLFHSYFILKIELDALKSKILTILDIHELSNLVVNTLYEILDINNICMLVYNPDSQTYHCASSSGFSVSETSRLYIPEDDLLLHNVIKNKNIIFRDTVVKSLSWQEASIVSHSFAKFRSHYIVPLIYNESIIGFMGLSCKRTGTLFTKRELIYIKGFTTILSLCIHNAIAFSVLKKKNEDS